MTVSSLESSTSRFEQTRQPEFHYQLIDPQQQKYRMQTIWQLVAGNLAANGDVLPSDAMNAAKDPDYDFINHTRVVVIQHSSGRLAGTFSVTLDGDHGMPVSRHFDSELSFLRRKHRLINGWRFSMSPLYQGAILRQRTFTLFKQLVCLNDADAFVIYYNQRLEKYYHRLFNGRVVASKSISFDGHHSLPVNLMLCQASDNPPDPRYMHDGALYEADLVS
ncbi:hypothetical protein [Reinekea sp. G2M2-21]|uniref:N-acyl amino acid synthase FeeM domain-containing protein n=1 Tax=Reinekea sp. G2M2-21 TaxID=2788942 RepID=UPI0018AA4E5F|nr:hypothetical protein [Reinekea sp. G2M2-21]